MPKKKLPKSYAVPVNVIRKPVLPEPTPKPEPQKIVAKKPAPVVVERIQNEKPHQHHEKREEIVVPPKKERSSLSIQKISKKFVHFMQLHRIFVGVGSMTTLLIVVLSSYLYKTVLYQSGIPSLLPENTVAFASVSTSVFNPQLRSLFQVVGSRKNDISAQEFFSRLPETSEIRTPLATLDIQSVLGAEAGYALIPTTEGSADVVALNVPLSRDAKKILEEISKEKNLEQKEYKGKTIFIVSDTADATRSFAYVYTNNYVFITSDTASPFLLVDVAKRDASSLAKKDSYRNLEAESRRTGFAHFYLDTKRSSEIFSRFQIPQSSNIGLLENSKVSLFGTFFVYNDAVSFQVLAPRSATNASKGNALTNTMKAFPQTTAFAVSGNNFDAQWDSVENTLTQGNPLIAFYIENLKKRLRDSFQFDLQEDFLSYLSKDFAVAVDQTTSRSKNTGAPYNNTAFVFRLSDPAAFRDNEPALQEKLKKILSSQLDGVEVRITNETYARLDLRVISSERLPGDIYYIVAGDSLYISTNKNFFSNIEIHDQPALGDATSFVAISDASPKSALRAYYVNVANVPLGERMTSLSEVVDAILVTEQQQGDVAEFIGTLHLAQ